MRVLILCAGQGTRLRPLTNDKPKCLVPLLGKPLIELQTDAIKACEISDISLVTGFAAEQLASYGSRHFHNAEFARTNMVASLFQASSLFDGKEDLIISYSDIVYEPRVLQSLIDVQAPLSTVIDMNWLSLWQERMDDPLADAETLKLSSDGMLMEIGKKPLSLDDIEGQYIGLTKISADIQTRVLEIYNAVDRGAEYGGMDFGNMYMTAFLEILMTEGLVIEAACIEGGWLEVDTLEDLNIYEGLAASGKLARFWRGSRPDA